MAIKPPIRSNSGERVDEAAGQMLGTSPIPKTIETATPARDNTGTSANPELEREKKVLDKRADQSQRRGAQPQR